MKKVENFFLISMHKKSKYKTKILLNKKSLKNFLVLTNDLALRLLLKAVLTVALDTLRSFAIILIDLIRRMAKRLPLNPAFDEVLA